MTDQPVRTGTRPAFIWGAVVLGAALLAVVVFVFQPQTLFFDSVVEDEFPVGAQPEPGDAIVPADEMSDDVMMADDMPEMPDANESSTEPAGPMALFAGEFRARSHPATGTATIYDLGDGERVLRFEDLDTDNGPDLFVYLSAITPDGSASEVEDVYVSLGKLKGNQGDQNYDIPGDVDLSLYNSVVIWCDRFSVAFGAAPLDVN